MAKKKRAPQKGAHKQPASGGTRIALIAAILGLVTNLISLAVKVIELLNK